jgi:hypothetical protein
MPDDKKTIEPIDADFDEVARKMVAPAPSLSSNNRGLIAAFSLTPAPLQLPLARGLVWFHASTSSPGFAM